MACGDHIRARRFGYWHHGIDCGDGTVIHYEGELFRAKDAKVRRVTWHEFARNGEVRTVPEPCAYDPETVVERAVSRLGECGYCAFANNCEHFARWCASGIRESRQVDRVLAVASGVAVATAGALATIVLAKAIGSRQRRLI